jgi:Holliday junction resolvase RusA-like endonuclease
MIPMESKVSLNTYYQGRAKKELMADIKRQLPQLTPIDPSVYPVQLVITIFRQSNHGTDIGNYSVIEKFTTDALVHGGIFLDDSWKYISSVTFVDGGKDPKNPRAEYVICKDGQPLTSEPLDEPENMPE